MTEPTPNLPLLRKILDHIDAHPEEHDQETWESACGTTRCVAGWALHFDGQKVRADGSIPRRAREVLGLTVSESEALFFDTCTPSAFDLAVESDDDQTWRSAQRAAVQIVAERIAARAGEVL